MALLLPIPLESKISTTKLIHYFSNHPVAFGFQASSPPNNISMNAANKKTDQSPSDFQTGTGAAAHTTLQTEQLTSHTRTAFVDTTASLHSSDGEVIPLSEAHELHTNIHDIL